MRIGLFTTDFPLKDEFKPSKPVASGQLWGGVAEVAYDLAMHLDSKGHQVKVFTTSPTKEDMVHHYRSIDVYRYAWKTKVENTLLSPKLLWGPLHHELDVVHAHLGTPPGAFSGYLYSIMKGRPLAVTIHTAYNPALFSDGSLAKSLAFSMFDGMFYRRMLERAEVITSVSRSVLLESPSCASFSCKARVIPNGIDLEKVGCSMSKADAKKELGLDPDSHVMLYVGSLSTVKRPDMLIRAFAKVMKMVSNVSLIVIGEGSLRNELDQLVKELHLEERVRLPGFVGGEEKYRYYRAADMFVLPSKSETFGLVVVEAMAFGLPIVVSDLDVFRYMLKERENCLFFTNGDPADLAAKMGTLMSDNYLRSCMSMDNLELAKRFDQREILGLYDAMYADMGTAGMNDKKKRRVLETV